MWAAALVQGQVAARQASTVSAQPLFTICCQRLCPSGSRDPKICVEKHSNGHASQLPVGQVEWFYRPHVGHSCSSPLLGSSTLSLTLDISEDHICFLGKQQRDLHCGSIVQ